MDLSDFIARLYSMLLPLSFSADIDAREPASPAGPGAPGGAAVLDSLFRALSLIFSPRSAGATAAPWRAAAFAKRLLTAALHWPPRAALRALDFVGGLLAKDGKLGALLATEDCVSDGVYRADVDDPQVSNPFATSLFELHALHTRHWDARVRAEAGKLLDFKA